MIETSRRSLIKGLVSLVAAPAIVRASSLMPVKAIDSKYLVDEQVQTVVWQGRIWYWEKQTIYYSTLSSFDDVVGWQCSQEIEA